MKKNQKIKKDIICHVLGNDGAVYIWFLIFLTCTITMLSGITLFARLNITISNMKNEIEIASDAVLAEYKDLDYTILRDPGNSETVSNGNPYITTFTEKRFAEKLAYELGDSDKANSLVTCDDNVITQFSKTNGENEEIYKITITNIETSDDGKLTVNFDVDMNVQISSVFTLSFSDNYTKTAQLYLKEY